MSRLMYEQLVADVLSREGWDTRVTKGSGDQGIDVIAQKGATKLVLQCKLYSHPVATAPCKR